MQDQAAVAESASNRAVQPDVIRALDAVLAAGVPVVAGGTRGGAIHTILNDRLGTDRNGGLSSGGKLVATDLDHHGRQLPAVVHKFSSVESALPFVPTAKLQQRPPIADINRLTGLTLQRLGRSCQPVDQLSEERR